VGRSVLSAVVVGVTWGVLAVTGSHAKVIRPNGAFGGGQGYVLTRVSGAALSVNAALALPGGGVVVAGQWAPLHGGPTGDVQIFVARYLADGRLDPRFGTRGLFRTRFPNRQGPFNATALARDAAGRLLVAGGYGQGSMLVLRLTAGGHLDRSFGPAHAGLAKLAVGGIANSMVVQRSGDIVLGGSDANIAGRPMVVARLSGRGTLDRHFGRAGVERVLFWNPISAASSGTFGLFATPDGGLVGAGHIDYIGTGGYGKAGLFRLNVDGHLARDFGQHGHALIGFKDPRGMFASWFPCAMTLTRSGQITVTGDGSLGRGNQILTIRLTRRGRLDRSFGRARNGRAVIAGLPSSSNPICAASRARHGDVIVGVTRTLAQLRPDGSQDLSFGASGLFRIVSPRGAMLGSIVRAGLRQIIVAGAAQNAAWVARYTITARPRRLG
jgi:uncharacterized delta-60 repeat protein